jgi:hypothetical protein
VNCRFCYAAVSAANFSGHLASCLAYIKKAGFVDKATGAPMMKDVKLNSKRSIDYSLDDHWAENVL